jgi:hypothetical protein
MRLATLTIGHKHASAHRNDLHRTRRADLLIWPKNALTMTFQNENRPVATGGFDTSSLFSSSDDQEIARKFVSEQAAYPSAAKHAREASGPLPQIRLQYFAERLHRLGPRALFHFLDELLHRYLAEFDFRYNNRSGLGVEDNERSEKAVGGAAGKRLFYQEPRPASHA